jgi:hypothetical protein
MKLSSILREIAVLVYFFIFFKGTYVSFPMILYLLFTVGDFGTAQQVFSGIAFVGLIIHFLHPTFKSKTKKLVVNALVFLFLLTPMVQKLFTLPLERFNYRWFLLPAIAFTVLYLASLFFLFKQRMLVKQQKEELIVTNVKNNLQGE